MDRTFEATISGLYISQQAPPRTRKERAEARAEPISSPRRSSRCTVTLEGFAGDRHAGLTRAGPMRACRSTRAAAEIRNTRQVSLVSEEELAELAAALGVPRSTRPGSVRISSRAGIPHLSQLPPGTRLFFPRKATMVIAEQNQPCGLPGGCWPGITPDCRNSPGASCARRVGRVALSAGSSAPE